ncbi:MAG: hypothetical protein ACXACI_12240 [Candidatus Hodarchaeales archaeon]|jgi:hypothetical protein
MKKLPFYGLTIVVLLVMGSVYAFQSFEDEEEDRSPPDLFGFLDLAVSGNMGHTASTTPAGPALSGHEGTTYWYNLTTIDWPEQLLFEEAPVFFTSDLAGTNLFLKVLREGTGPDGAIYNWQTGVELDDNITIQVDMDHPDAPPADEFPASLTEITIPAGATIVIPGTDWGFGNISRLFEDDPVMKFLRDEGQLEMLQPLLDPAAMAENNQTFEDVFRWAQEHIGYVVEDRMDPSSYYDWDSFSGVELIDERDGWVLENTSMPFDRWITTRVPYGHIEGIWPTQYYDWDANPRDQPWEEQLHIDNHEHPVRFHVNDERTFTGQPVTIAYKAWDALYVDNDQVRVSEPIELVHGVWRHREYDWDLGPENATDQRGEDLWDGVVPTVGSYVIGINQSLSEQFEPVVAVYNMSNPPALDWDVDYTPGNWLNVSVNLTRGDEQINRTYSWDATSGLLESMSLYLQGDFDENGTRETGEYLNLVLERDPSRVNANIRLPGDAGYAGAYALSNMNLDVNASDSWLAIWDLLPDQPPVEEFIAEYEGLEGDTIFQYTVTGVDGNFYGLAGQLTNPLDDSEGMELPPFIAVNGFDGRIVVNATEMPERQDELRRGNLEDYMAYIASTTPANNHYWLMGEDVIIENATATNIPQPDGPDGLGHRTLMHISDVIGVWNASEYRWDQDPWSQQDYSILEGWVSPNSVYLNDWIYDGEEIIIAYHPQRHLFLYDNRLYVEHDIREVMGIYKAFEYDWDREPWEPQSAPNYYSTGSYVGTHPDGRNNNTIVLGSPPPGAPPLVTWEHMVVVYKWAPMPGYKLYLNMDDLGDNNNGGDDPPKMQALSALQDNEDSSTGRDDDDDDEGGPDWLQEVFPVPLRTADWWATDNMVNPVNTIYSDEITGIIEFLEIQLNQQAAEEGAAVSGILTDVDVTIDADTGVIWIDSFFNVTFEVDGQSDPTDSFPVDTLVELEAHLFAYRNYSAAGIFEDAGFELEVSASITAQEPYTQESWWTAPWWISSEPSSIPSDSEEPSSEDTASAITPGFGIFAVLFVGTALLLWRRKQ